MRCFLQQNSTAFFYYGVSVVKVGMRRELDDVIMSIFFSKRCLVALYLNFGIKRFNEVEPF